MNQLLSQLKVEQDTNIIGELSFILSSDYQS